MDTTESDDYEDIDDDPEVPWCMSSRLGLALISFLGLMTMTSQRACMRVALPCMVNQSAVDAEAGIIRVNGSRVVPTVISKGPSPKSLYKSTVCQPGLALLSQNLTIEPVQDGEFLWNENEQLAIHKTFYWGYLLSQVPAGWFACRFGSRLILGGFMLVSSVSTLLVPMSTGIDYYILLVVRFAGGLGAGAVYPSIIALWAKWAPPGERTRLVTISFSGANLGLVLSYPLSALLCRYGFAGGWRSIFYIYGAVGCVWSAVWVMYVSDSPIIHPRITKEEKIYIVQSLSGETDIEPNTDPVTLVLPYLGLWLTVLVCGVWADKLRTRAIVSTSLVRKIMQSIGTLCPAGLLVALGFLDCNQVAAAIAIDILGIASIGFQFSGFLVNHLDIYPKYAGVAIGLCNSVGAVAEIVAPIFVRIVTKEDSQQQWQNMFFITAAFLGFSALCFLTCGTGDLQEWAVCKEYILEDSSSKSSESGSDYNSSNDGTATASDDSDDVISGEKPRKKSLKDAESNESKPKIKKINQSGKSPNPTDRHRRPKVELPEFITTAPAPIPVRLTTTDPPPLLTPVTPINRTPSPMPDLEDNTIFTFPDVIDENAVPPSPHKLDDRNSASKFDDLANLLSQYDTLPARGRDRSVSPFRTDRLGFQPYVNHNLPSTPALVPSHRHSSLDRPSRSRTRSRTRSPSPYPGMDRSLPHSISSESPYDVVGTPYVRSRQASPASGSYASLQRPPSPSVNMSLLPRRPLSRTSSGRFNGTPTTVNASPPIPPRVPLTGLDVTPRQRSLTPTSFPQPESIGVKRPSLDTFPQPESSAFKRPSIDSSEAFEQLEESVV